uniref:Uncharacterized protein n=1 Tax=Anguilla anguilla TaxID=7936 RepID=A0A0E9PGW8_ANGAN
MAYGLVWEGWKKMSWREEHFKSFHVFSVLFFSDHLTIDT